LLALGRLQQQGQWKLAYREIERPLKDLLRDFGRPQGPFRPEYPFFYLQSDGVWELETFPHLPPGKYTPTPGLFRDWEERGGFPAETFQAFREDQEAIRQVASLLLTAHFPETLHGDLLQAVGLDLEVTGASDSFTRIRDPRFRQEVLTAYGYQCAVCGLKIEMQDKTVAIEAAHIQWHQAGGPDRTVNGLALCTLHHKLFDVGAFTLNPELRISVSSMAHGNSGFRRWLLDFNGEPITQPSMLDMHPQEDFLKWHVREVFKGQPRYALDLD
jgi:putative restriction endonuclease